MGRLFSACPCYAALRRPPACGKQTLRPAVTALLSQLGHAAQDPAGMIAISSLGRICFPLQKHGDSLAE